MDYREVINGYAMSSVEKSVQIPDYHLMVGTAECLHSLPIIHYADYVPRSMANAMVDTEKLSYEEIQESLASGKLTINDFYQNIYPFGDAIVK